MEDALLIPVSKGGADLSINRETSLKRIVLITQLINSFFKLKS